MRRLPPLNFLRAFEAVARNRSFTLAAEELCLTQAAVSQQIKSLEQSLGAQLISRESRKLVLTKAGDILLPVVQNALHRISDAADEIHALKDSRQLRVNVSRFLLTHWLELRLKGFALLHPDVDVSARYFYQALNVDAFVRDEVDLVLCWGRPPWPGLGSDLLFRLQVTPVCSPELAKSRSVANLSEDLRDLTLLRTYYDWWPEWTSSTGASVDLDRGQYIYDFDALISAVLEGRGVAMLPLSVGVSNHIDAGRLIRLSPHSVETKDGYYVVSSTHTIPRAWVTSFREWILSESACERENPIR